jgi:hypothetical protein
MAFGDSVARSSLIRFEDTRRRGWWRNSPPGVRCRQRQSMMPVANLSPAAAHEAAPGPVARIARGIAVPLSKREFLRGRFLGGDRDDRR